MEYQNEIWKDVVGYESLYQVSNKGRVRSLFRYKLILTRLKNVYGYYNANLYKRGKNKYAKICRLELIAFKGYEEGMQVNHIDGDKSNDCLENLEWVTASENLKHAFKLGLKDKKGEKHHLNKLDNKSILEIRGLYDTGLYSQRTLGSKYSVSQSTISGIIKKMTWKHI